MPTSDVLAHSRVSSVGVVAPARAAPPAQNDFGRTDFVEIDLSLAGISPQTALFTPSGFSAVDVVDVVLYLHGFRVDAHPPKTIAEYLERPYGRLREAVNASGRNVAFVAPTLGDRSEAGRLVESGGLDRLCTLVLATLRGRSGRSSGELTLRNLFLAAHSGGGKPMRAVAGGGDDALANLRECWGFDSAYNWPDITFWPKWARLHSAASCYLYYRADEDPPTVRDNVEAIARTDAPNIIVKVAATEEHMMVPVVHFAARLRGARGLDDKPGFVVPLLPSARKFDLLHSGELAMTNNLVGGGDSASPEQMTTAAFTERDLAQGVTGWMISHFQPQLADAIRSTPFTAPLLCAIACREAGMFWLPLTPHKSPADILGLCVYDASGDVPGAPRSAFPINTAQFRLAYGEAFTNDLISEANKARAARGLAPSSIVYKGYGIFQYDLQSVRTDEVFFRSKQWYDFAQCVKRAVAELKNKLEATGDIQDAVRAYNGSGPNAEQYARDVMRLLPFCEEAAASAPGPAFVAAGSRPAVLRVASMAESGAVPSDDDPAAPGDDEISDTADFQTARLLANLGSPTVQNALPSVAAPFAAGATLQFDLSRAKAFLHACMTSNPRVTYGLGAKVPFLGAVPGRDFTKVDCSGFVREAVLLATTPPAPFPDGSVVQHDWVRAHGFDKSTIADGMKDDNVVRIAFLRPQDSPQGIGHVVLISGGMTLESHGHGQSPGQGGPDSRKWDGQSWRAKAFVYVLSRGAQLALMRGTASFGVAVGSSASSEASVAAPAIVGSARGDAMPRMSANVFRTASLPSHHDDLLVVKMRPEAMSTNPSQPMAGALNFATLTPQTVGLNALSFYERAGAVKRVVPLRKHNEGAKPAARLPAAAALMLFSPQPGQPTDANVGVSFIELERGQDSQQLRSALASDPNVLSVAKVPARYLAARAPRRAPQAGGIGIEAAPPSELVLWNLKKILWGEARSQANFQEADNVRVAVLDTGVDDQHPDLRVDEYHWQQTDLSSPVSNRDLVGHGTHVSGTIAALLKNDVAVKGICRCRLIVHKIFDDTTAYAPSFGGFVYLVNPIIYRRALAACVETPADVINLSIGGPGTPDAVEQSLFDQLLAAGVTICAAMGNDRQSGSPTSYPAAIPGVIAVGATGLDDGVAVFSNSGNHIAVAAPGTAIWSTLPTYPGQTGFSADFGPNGTPTPGRPISREVKFDAWNGTSMAAPHVSGCAALLIAKNNAAGNKLTPEQVRQALMTTADKVLSMNGADFSIDCGAGRVNLLRLLQ